MSSPDPSSPAGTIGPFCGNCGKPVAAADVTCPACGVLLAAYQAPAGATGSPMGATPAMRDGASSPMASAPPPPDPQPVSPSPPTVHEPRSQSPIGDGLRRSRQPGSTGGEGLASDAIADELAEMAADDSALAREVEAELAGARVTFDGNDSVIETERVDIGHTEAGAPVVVAPEPPPSAPPASARPAPVQPPVQPPRSIARATPPVARPVAEPVAAPEGQPAMGGVTPVTLVRWLPFIMIGCVMLVIGRSLPGFGGVFGFVLVIGLIYFLIKVAAASSRKTTSMPRDTTWNAPRSRWRK